MENNIKEIIKILKESKSIILDVDFDFFFDSEDDILCNPWKKRTKNFYEFKKLHSELNFHPIIGHEEALDLWQEKKIKNATCLHIDHHHDLYINEETFFSTYENQFSDSLNYANYLYFALRKNIIKNIIWVYPDSKKDLEEVKLFKRFLKVGNSFYSVPYSFYKNHIYKLIYLNEFNSFTSNIALSPDFVSRRDIKFFFKNYKTKSEFKYRALDYAYESIILQNNEQLTTRFPSNIKKTSNIYFHGSTKSNLRSLENKKNFISSSAGFACCYGLKLFNENFWVQGIDKIINSTETIYLIPKDKKYIHQLNKPMSLYGVKLKQRDRIYDGSLPNYINYSKNRLNILDEESFETTEEALKKYNVKVYHEDLFKISEFKKIKKSKISFTKWMSLNKNIICKYPSSIFFYSIYKLIFNKNNSSNNTFIPLIFWRRLIKYILLEDKSKKGYDKDPFHGLKHSTDVAELSICVSYLEKTNPLHAMFGALCHDFIRNYKNNTTNAIKSKTKLAEFFKSSWKDYYTEEIYKNASTAILNHIYNNPVLHKPSQILRDSDRYRLAWERGYQEKYFYTRQGKKIASRNLVYLRSFKELFNFENSLSLEIIYLEKQYRYEISLKYFKFINKILISKTLNKFKIISLVLHYNIKVINIAQNIILNKSFIKTLNDLDIKIVHVYNNNKNFLNHSSNKKKYSVIRTSSYSFFKILDSEKFINNKKISYHIELNNNNYKKVLDYLDRIVNDNIEVKFIVDFINNKQTKWLESFLDELMLRKKKNIFYRNILIYGNIPWCITPKIKYIFTCLAPRQYNVYKKKFYYYEKLNIKNLIEKKIDDLEERYKNCEHCSYFYTCGSFVSKNKIKKLRNLPGYKKTFHKNNYLFY